MPITTNQIINSINAIVTRINNSKPVTPAQAAAGQALNGISILLGQQPIQPPPPQPKPVPPPQKKPPQPVFNLRNEQKKKMDEQTEQQLKSAFRKTKK